MVEYDISINKMCENCKVYLECLKIDMQLGIHISLDSKDCIELTKREMHGRKS